MGCFFTCFRVRDRKRKNAHIAAGASPRRCREHSAVKNRALAAGLKSPTVVTQAPTSQLFEVISDQRKPETLHRRTAANLRWTQQLVAPAEVPVVQKPDANVKIVEKPQKELIPYEDDSLQNMDELVSELAELSKTIGKEVEDIEKFSNEVKYLRSRGTLKRSPMSKTQIVAVSEQSLQPADCGVKRVITTRQSVSMSTGESIVSEAQYSSEEVTKPTAIEIKVSDKEVSPSISQKKITESNKMSSRNCYSSPSFGKKVRFDVEKEIPSASFESANAGDEGNNYDSASDLSLSRGSYTLEEEEDEEGVLSERSQTYSCSYTGSDSTISEGSHSGQSADRGSEDDSVSNLTSSSRVNEDEDEAEESNSSEINTPALKRPSRYQNYESSSDEEEYDSLSETDDSYASSDSEERNRTQNIQQCEILTQGNQSPLLQKSSYSPLKPSRMNLTDDKQHSWTGCAEAYENASVNNNARIRAQYVYPVLNPVENLSQWRKVKKDSKPDAYGNNNEFYESSKSWVEDFEIPETQSKGYTYPKSSPTKKQRVEPRSAITETTQDSLHDGYSQAPDSALEVNSYPVDSLKHNKYENIMEVKEESTRRRKLIPLSAEPVFKQPKVFASQHPPNSNTVSEDVRPAEAVHVDASLSQWLKPTEAIENGYRELSTFKNSYEKLPKAGQGSRRQDVLESEVNTCLNHLQSQKQQATTMQSSVTSRSPSTPKADCRQILGTSGLKNPHIAAENWTSPSRSPSKNNDERPILGALSIESIKAAASNQISPKRSPSSKDLDDRPILGVVAVHWNDKQPVSPSKCGDEKGGIANSTNKYKEDQKVSWDSTPFEVRLERALSNRKENDRHATN
ncbi:hypothetical protein KI387_012822, partial [Taxus chinensis]